MGISAGMLFLYNSMPAQMNSNCTDNPVIQRRLKKRNSLTRRLKIQSNKLAIKTAPINPYETSTYLPSVIPRISASVIRIMGNCHQFCDV